MFEIDNQYSFDTAELSAHILETIPVGLIIVNNNWEIIYANEKSQAITCVLNNDWKGKSLWQYFPAGEALKFYTALSAAVTVRMPLHFDHFFESLDLWLEVNVHPASNRLFVYLQGINEQKVQALRLREINNRFQQVLQVVSECIWEWEVGAPKAIWHGDKLQKLLGYDQSESGSVSFWEQSVHPEDLPAVKENMRKCFEQRVSEYEHRYRLRKKDGNYIHVRDRALVISDSKGTPVKVIGVTDDITIQQLYEQALRRSTLSYQSLFNFAPNPKLVIDQQSLSILDVNECAIKQYGYSRAEFLKMNISGICSKASFDEFLDRFRNDLSLDGTWTCHKKNGDHLIVKMFVTPLEFLTQNVFLITLQDVTERKKTEQALIASEQKMAGLLESLGDGFFSMDRRWSITYINAKAEALLGMDREDLLGRNFWEVFKDAMHLNFYREYQRAMNDRVPVRFEEYYPGLNAWFELNAYPSSEGLSVYFKNISEKKAHEKEDRINKQKLQDVEDDLKNVLESMTDGFYTLDRDWNIKYATDKVAAMLGVDKEEYIGRNIWESFPEVIQSKFYTAYHRAFAENTFVTFEEYLPIFNMWFEVNAYPYKNVLACYIKDITERKKDKKRLEFIARATSEVIWELDLPTKEAVINPENFYKVFGHQLAGRQDHFTFWQEMVHPEDLQQVIKNNCAALEKSKEDFVHEYRFQKSDGSWAYVKDRVYVVVDEQGKAAKLIGAMQDITGEKKAAFAVIESEQTYRTLFDQASLPKVVYDKETYSVLKVNKAAMLHYGYTNEEFLQLTIMDLRPAEDREKVVEVIKSISGSKRTDAGVWTHIKKSGELLRAEISIASIHFEGKWCNLATVNDVTEKLRLNEQLTREKIEKQREITIATLKAQEKERSEIGRELHDGVNQVLATAKLYVENIRYYPEQQAVFIDKSIQLLQNSIQEIRVLSKALVTPTIADLGFRDAMIEMFQTYKDLKQFDIDFFIHRDVEYIEKEIKLTIYRIFQEQLNNTVKYAKATKVKAHIRFKQGMLQLSIADNGVGFDMDLKKTGLGLNNIRNRAELFMGHLNIVTAPGKGCKLEISFPVQTSSGE